MKGQKEKRKPFKDGKNAVLSQNVVFKRRRKVDL
jgi:hypothetical protein